MTYRTLFLAGILSLLAAGDTAAQAIGIIGAGTPVNYAPVAEPQEASTGGTPIVITLTGEDPNGDPVTFDIVDDPLHGAISEFDPDIGIVTYTPVTGFAGIDSFTFVVNDGIVDSELATVTITVVSPADLIMSSLSAPSKSGAGATIVVTSTTKNRVGNAGASITMIYLSTDTTLDAGDTVLGSRAVPTLAPGATNAGAVSTTIPPATTAGPYYLIAQADADNVVPETNESNNKKTRSINIGPDLIVSALSAPSSANMGATITVTSTTKNQGGGSAEASTTTIYLSKNSTLDAADVLLNSRTVIALAPGATNAGPVAVTIPPGTATGTHYLIAKGDTDNVVVEVTESNNIKSKAITIK